MWAASKQSRITHVLKESRSPREDLYIPVLN
jgi:hypothetical protein